MPLLYDGCRAEETAIVTDDFHQRTHLLSSTRGCARVPLPFPYTHANAASGVRFPVALATPRVATRSHAVQWWYSQVPCAGRAGLGAARVRRACGLCASVSMAALPVPAAAARVVTLRVSDQTRARAAARLVRSHGLSQAGLTLGSAWARGRAGAWGRSRRLSFSISGIAAPPASGGRQCK